MRMPRILATVVAVAALVVGVTVPAASASAATVSTAPSGLVQSRDVKTTLVGFNPGNIISDAVFTNKGTMTEAQIQTFFNSKVSRCLGGKDEDGKPIVCLKDFRISSVTRPADAYCNGYTGAANESAARIIYRVAQSCNINPQVLIVMLQKEQGLITHTWPSAWRYNIALGQGCPDTAPCDPNFIGFFHQIYGAARQMQIYMEGKSFQWYAPGKTWSILYNPNRACGSSPVYVANKATSALYYYTPYQPNAAALRAGYGLGDTCSAYGNRNFYNYFTDWFGATQVSNFTVGKPIVNGYVIPGQVVTATGVFTPAPTTTLYQWYRNGVAIPGATGRSYNVTVADSGAKIDVRLTAKRAGYVDAGAQSATFTALTVKVDRIAGTSREQTAVETSRLSWPAGTRTVFLATSLDFPDALSAVAAASRSQASLLLTPPGALPAFVANEIKRLAPTRVVLVGGAGVVSEAVAAQVKTAVPAAKIDRIGGADRYATSRALVETFGSSANVMVATGADFPDALSAAAAGGAGQIPVLLVDGAAAAADAPTIATLRKLGATKVTVVGGTGVVRESIVTQLKGQGYATNRLFGNDRYLTNVAVNNAYFPQSALRVFVATGAGFPDALTGASAAGRFGVPLVLSPQTCLFPEGAEFLRVKGATTVSLIGGTGVLSAEGVGQLRRC